MIGLIITTEMQRQAYAPTFFSGCNTVLMHVTTAATADQVMVKRDATSEKLKILLLSSMHTDGCEPATFSLNIEITLMYVTVSHWVGTVG